MTLIILSDIITPKFGGITLQEKDNLIKQINKLIFGKVLEISVVIGLVSLSIPAWSAFAAKIDDVDIIKKEDCKLKYNEKRDNEVDYLTIDNNYAFNKNYKIYLETTKNIDLSTKIIINNRSYILNDFYQSEEENTIKFTLIDKNVVASTDAYNIIVKADEYNYIFEEINNF